MRIFSVQKGGFIEDLYLQQNHSENNNKGVFVYYTGRLTQLCYLIY